MSRVHEILQRQADQEEAALRGGPIIEQVPDGVTPDTTSSHQHNLGEVAQRTGRILVGPSDLPRVAGAPEDGSYMTLTEVSKLIGREMVASRPARQAAAPEPPLPEAHGLARPLNIIKVKGWRWWLNKPYINPQTSTWLEDRRRARYEKRRLKAQDQN